MRREEEQRREEEATRWAMSFDAALEWHSKLLPDLIQTSRIENLWDVMRLVKHRVFLTPTASPCVLGDVVSTGVLEGTGTDAHPGAGSPVIVSELWCVELWFLVIRLGVVGIWHRSSLAQTCKGSWCWWGLKLGGLGYAAAVTSRMIPEATMQFWHDSWGSLLRQYLRLIKLLLLIFLAVKGVDSKHIYLLTLDWCFYMFPRIFQWRCRHWHWSGQRKSPGALNGDLKD